MQEVTAETAVQNTATTIYCLYFEKPPYSFTQSRLLHFVNLHSDLSTAGRHHSCFIFQDPMQYFIQSCTIHLSFLSAFSLLKLWRYSAIQNCSRC